MFYSFHIFKIKVFAFYVPFTKIPFVGVIKFGKTHDVVRLFVWLV